MRSLGIVGVGARVDVDEVVFERAIDQDGELARCGGDRFRLADAEGQTTVERAEGGLGAPSVIAARRKMAAARFADGCVRLLEQTAAGDP